MSIAYLIGLALVFWILLFYNFNNYIWLAVFSCFTYFSYQFNFLNLFFTLFTSLLFLCSFTLLSFSKIRSRLITSKLLEFFKSKLPKISKTEEQAIDAGDTWWEGDIFKANLDYAKIDDFKLTKLTVAEQNFINNEVKELCELLCEWDAVHNNKDLSQKAWDYIKQHKFMAVSLPKEHGGLGFSAVAQSCIVTKVASKSITAAVSIMVPNALGPGELITHYGTDEQKKYYLPRLANATDIPCFALTSPYAGSDAGGIPDHGIITKDIFDGKETLGIKLNFNKRYITLAPISTLMGLAFKLYDPNYLYSKTNTDLGITVAIIPTNIKGITIGNRHCPMLTPFQNGPIVGSDVFIPLDYIVGGEKNIGNGWRMLMECLSAGRGISLPALSTATTQLAAFSSLAYSNLRMQFKTPIIKLEGITEKLAEIMGYNFIVNAMRLVTASSIDHGLKPAVVSGIAKYHMTEFARKAINNAMDIHAGKGVMNGPDNYLAGHYIAGPIAITVEGANILTRNLIIFGQGAFRAHPYVLSELNALKESNTKQAVTKFDKILFNHIGFVFSNIIKLKTYAIQRIFYYKLVKNNNWFKAYKKDLSRLSSGLSLCTDMALLFIGGNLKIKERLSARLGDVVSYIYMAMCVVKYHGDLLKYSNNSNIKHILDDYLKWSLEYCLYKAQNSLCDFISNFPNKYIATMLKLVIFPWGKSYSKSDDKLEQDLISNLLKKLNKYNYEDNNLNNNIYNSFFDLLYVNYKSELPKKSEELDKLAPLEVLFYLLNKQAKLKSKLDDIYSFAANKQIAYSNNLNLMIEEAMDNNLITTDVYQELSEYARLLDKIINVNDFSSLLHSQILSDRKEYA